MNIKVIKESKSLIAESPVYDEANKKLYWIDNQNPILHGYDLTYSKYSKLNLEKPLRCLDLKAANILVGVMGNEFVEINLTDNNVKTLIQNIVDKEVLFNDGKLDAKGRFWVGTMDPEFSLPTEVLYCIDKDLKINQKEKNIIVCNGLGWSANNKIFYFTDTMQRTIYKYDFCLESGEISNKTIFAQTPEDKGFPDGLCVDKEGYIWSAHWGGFRVTRYAPNGKVDMVIEMPARNITSCCMAGDILLVTSASMDFQGYEELGKDAGCVFIVTL